MIPKSDIENWVGHHAGTKGSSGNNAIVREIERLRAAIQHAADILPANVIENFLMDLDIEDFSSRYTAERLLETLKKHGFAVHQQIEK